MTHGRRGPDHLADAGRQDGYALPESRSQRGLVLAGEVGTPELNLGASLGRFTTVQKYNRLTIVDSLSGS